jgi:hypothetical protein
MSYIRAMPWYYKFEIDREECGCVKVESEQYGFHYFTDCKKCRKGHNGKKCECGERLEHLECPKKHYKICEYLPHPQSRHHGWMKCEKCSTLLVDSYCSVCDTTLKCMCGSDVSKGRCASSPWHNIYGCVYCGRDLVDGKCPVKTETINCRGIVCVYCHSANGWSGGSLCKTCSCDCGYRLTMPNQKTCLECLWEERKSSLPNPYKGSKKLVTYQPRKCFLTKYLMVVSGCGPAILDAIFLNYPLYESETNWIPKCEVCKKTTYDMTSKYCKTCKHKCKRCMKNKVADELYCNDCLRLCSAKGCMNQHAFRDFRCSDPKHACPCGQDQSSYNGKHRAYCLRLQSIEEFHCGSRSCDLCGK